MHCSGSQAGAGRWLNNAGIAVQEGRSASFPTEHKQTPELNLSWETKGDRAFVDKNDA